MSSDITVDVLRQAQPEATDFRRAGPNGPPMVKSVATGKWDRYRRVSSIGKVLDDDSNLTDWKRRTELLGAAQRPDLMAEVSTLDPTADKQRLREIAEECLVAGKGQERAITGTAIHRMLDLIDTGAEWTAAPHFQALCNAYVIKRDAYGLVPLECEVRCVVDHYRLAGSMDRRYQTTKPLMMPDQSTVPVGSVVVGDTKTGKSLEYAEGSFATQLAAYAMSMRYNVETDERSDFDPPFNQEWGFIFHLNHESAECDVYVVDLAAGREGIELASRVYGWRKRTGLLSPARAPLHVIPGEVSAPLPHPEPITASKGHTEAVPGPDVLSDVREWLRERAAAVRERGADAVDTLKLLWPRGVPGLRQDSHTEAQLNLIADAISLVEAQFEMSWPTPDPRKLIAASNRWANPTPNALAGAAPDHATDDDFKRMLHSHPRRAWLQRMGGLGMRELDPSITDRTALTHALYEFALLEGSDDDVTEMLDGTLRGMGFEDGVNQLGYVTPEQAPLIMSAAFALTSGTALLLIDASGRPIVRNVTK